MLIIWFCETLVAFKNRTDWSNSSKANRGYTCFNEIKSQWKFCNHQASQQFCSNKHCTNQILLFATIAATTHFQSIAQSQCNVPLATCLTSYSLSTDNLAPNVSTRGFDACYFYQGWQIGLFQAKWLDFGFFFLAWPRKKFGFLDYFWPLHSLHEFCENLLIILKQSIDFCMLIGANQDHEIQPIKQLINFNQSWLSTSLCSQKFAFGFFWTKICLASIGRCWLFLQRHLAPSMRKNLPTLIFYNNDHCKLHEILLDV
jgi:hypothetical protein